VTPKLSIVATVYNKDVKSLTTFFEGLKRQTSKEFELILVDDCSDVDYQGVIQRYGKDFRIEYIRLGRNSGQCKARNIGVRESSAEFICIVDSDCIPNARFAEVHIHELTHHEVKDVLIGAYNIESNGREIWGLIDQLQRNPAKRDAETSLQYPANPGYFLNFITRNVSFKRGAVPPGGMFNEDYAYVGTDPNSGFGWEDVEAGWNLFKSGLHFSYTNEAFTVHLSHPSTTDPMIKPLRSMRNFSRFLMHNPAVVYTEALPWIVETYGKIYSWFKNTNPTQEVFTDGHTGRPWGVVSIELTSFNEAQHPFVIESALAQWRTGVEIYLVGGGQLARYYATLHSYVKAVDRVPDTAHARKVTILLPDDMILPRGRMDRYSPAQPSKTLSRIDVRPKIGGFQSPTAFYHKDLRPRLSHTNRTVKRRLKILTYRWHVGHQYELWKLPHDFYVAEDDTTMAWDYSYRPFPKNAQFVKMDEIDPRDYDLALLHFDENVANPLGVSNDVLGKGWGAIFRRFLKETKGMPRVAICHGTPPFHGMFDVDYRGPDLMKEWDVEVNRIRNLVGNMPIVCNSYNAWSQWKFPNSRTIWQGFDSSEYTPGRRDRDFIYAANSIRHRPWYRGYYEFKYLNDLFKIDYLGRDDGGEFSRVEVQKAASRLPPQARAKEQFRLYQELLGRYSVFVNTTLRSPMPRTRAEAMLKGACLVSMDYHDESMFITNGLNGFTGKTKEELAEHLLWCQKNMNAARRMGMRGRETICRLFTHQRYLKEWQETLFDLVGG